MAPSAPSPVLLSVVTRSGRVESTHHGAAVVVEHGKVVHAWGDVEQLVYTRSCVKPFQALPFLERGLFERIGMTEPELAVMSASHDGTEEHVNVVRGFMQKAGVAEEALGCGPHAPYDLQSSLDIARRNEKPRPIHNNCSGKHTGFLRLARELDVPLERYLDPDSASQREIRAAVADMLELDAATIPVGLDGCGAPTFHVPLVALARGFAKLTTPSGLPTQRVAAVKKLLSAITHWPAVFSGHERLCSALITALPGRIYPKNGAEGVYTFGLTGTGLGVAIKVADGNERGYFPVVIDLLRRLGVLGEVPAALEAYRRHPIYNTQKILVGHVESALP